MSLPLSRLSRIIPIALMLPLLLSPTVEANGQVDVIVRQDGSEFRGEIVESKDGQYWMVLENGTMVSVPFDQVARVVKAADAPAPPPTTTVRPAQAPDPDWVDPAANPPSKPRTNRRTGVGGGIEVGPVTAGRLRFWTRGNAIHHVDLRLGATVWLMNGYYPLPAPFIGTEVSFMPNSPLHLAVTSSLAMVYLYYPSVNVGAGIQFDTKGPFEAKVGLAVGTATMQSYDYDYYGYGYGSVSSYTAIGVIPDISVGWVW